MFKCLIVTSDLFIRQGLSALIKESLTVLDFKGELVFNENMATHTDAIFIDADDFNFHLNLEKVVSCNSRVEIFVICHEHKNNLKLNSIKNNVANIIYKEEGSQVIKAKITRVFQQYFKLKTHVFLKRNVKSQGHFNSRYNESMTKNEYEVMNLFIRGLSGKSIALILRKSEKTISTQKRSVMNKLGVRTNQELLRKFLSE